MTPTMFMTYSMAIDPCKSVVIIIIIFYLSLALQFCFSLPHANVMSSVITYTQVKGMP